MSKRIPPLPALRAFSAFIRLGSIQAAAEDLSLTAGAVSHQIRALEDFLQLTLLDRQGRRMSLTEQGRIYGYQVRQALEDLASATETTARRTHNRSRQSAVRVSVLPSCAQGWLLPRLGAFCRRHPRSTWPSRPQWSSSTSVPAPWTAPCDSATATGPMQSSDR